MNSFPTAEFIALALTGILVFGAVISLPLLEVKDAYAMKISESKTYKKTMDASSSNSKGGISIYGCPEGNGPNGGISIYGCAKGGAGPNGGQGGIAVFGTANGGDTGADGANGVQGQNGTAGGGTNPGKGGTPFGPDEVAERPASKDPSRGIVIRGSIGPTAWRNP